MPFKRFRVDNPDVNQSYLDQIALSVFRDMEIITQQQYTDAINGGVSAQIDLLHDIKDLEGKQASEFSERYIDKILDVNERWFDCVPPSTLAKAYIATKEKLQQDNITVDKYNFYKERLNKISNRMDDLIDNFASKIGYYFADTTNIADIYAGYNEMFDAREPDLDTNSNYAAQIKANREALERYMAEYDNVWGISNVTESEKQIDSLTKNYDAASKQAEGYTPSESVLETASGYKFLDANGNPLPQFKYKGAEHLKVDTYQPGRVLDENSRLAQVVDLARHDFALHHINDDNVSEISEEDIQKEIDKGVLYKLFEIDTAEKIVSGAMEDPDRFTDPRHFQDFVDNLNNNGGSISNDGYEAAMDAQVNKTAGLAGRIKQKLGKLGQKASGLFGKMFKPIQNIDKRKDDRFQTIGKSAEDKRQKRIEFILRMLKGFGCAFLVSGALTVIATAGAAITGVSLAASVATIGIITASVMTAIQIHKWRKAQRAAGKDDGIKALLQDKRMVAMLGTTGIAAIAMIFGAAGVTTAAVSLGYGALALGSGNNAISTFKDARSAGMGMGESIAWALANAAAVVAGGFAGRAVANNLIDSYNESQKSWEKIGEHEEQEIVYKQETLDNAERICKMWYRDNPDLLQQRVEMVEAYNAQHGTNINPYRAIMINGDAGGMTADNMALHVDGGGVVHSHAHHTVMTPRWAAEHGFSMDEVDAMRHMFDGNQISDAAINAAMKADPGISPINEVGYMTGRPEHHDGVLYQNTVDADGNPVFTTYAGGDTPYEVKTNIIEDFGWVDNGVENIGAMGTFGNYNKRRESELKDRPGAFADKIIHPYRPGPEPGPEPGPQPKPVKTILALPPHKEQLALPAHEEKLALPEHKEQLALPAHVEKIKPQWLKITRAQAKKLDDLEKCIATTEKQLSNPKLKPSKRNKLKAELKKWEQDLRELKNELGNPDNSTLWAAQYWAFRKEDLEVAQARLAKVSQRRIDGNTDKYTKAEILKEIDSLKAKFAEYEAEIPDESLFYDPVAVQYDKESGSKIEKLQLAKKRLQMLQAKQRLENNKPINYQDNDLQKR